jgi:hypothetical protein
MMFVSTSLQGEEAVGLTTATIEAAGLTDSCPSWCAGGCDDDAVHATEFEGPVTEPDTDAIARLVQDGDAAPAVELGVNDADGGSAAVRLSLEQARELAGLLNDLVAAAESEPARWTAADAAVTGGAVTAAPGPYTALATGAQIFCFADLTRRLTQAYGPDEGRQLHQDMADGLFALVGLTPEPSDEDGDAYLAAGRAGQLPAYWSGDSLALTETPAEWTERARARRAAPVTWPGLAPEGAARYEIPLTAADILSFETLVARLARRGRDGDDLVVRHDLWASLNDFAALLPEPSEDDVAGYLAAVGRGELPDWHALPLTETTAEWVERTRARRAAEEGEGSE